MKTMTTRLIAVGALMLITACGNNPGDRALSGAGIGAGAGAVGGALIGANPVTGAIIGGAAGAAAGGLTKKKDVDLGDPVWR